MDNLTALSRLQHLINRGIQEEELHVVVNFFFQDSWGCSYDEDSKLIEEFNVNLTINGRLYDCVIVRGSSDIRITDWELTNA
jgi:hypothetical protein